MTWLLMNIFIHVLFFSKEASTSAHINFILEKARRLWTTVTCQRLGIHWVKAFGYDHITWIMKHDGSQLYFL